MKDNNLEQPIERKELTPFDMLNQSEEKETFSVEDHEKFPKKDLDDSQEDESQEDEPQEEEEEIGGKGGKEVEMSSKMCIPQKKRFQTKSENALYSWCPRRDSNARHPD